MSSPSLDITDNSQPSIVIVDFRPESSTAETEALTSASSLTASAFSSQSFCLQGGTLKRNVHGQRLEASRANELVFLHDSVPALKKYNAVIEQRNHANSNTY
jgi:hypothetical protein